MGSIPDLFLTFLQVTRRMLQGIAAWYEGPLDYTPEI